MKRPWSWLTIALLGPVASLLWAGASPAQERKVQKSDAEWSRLLTQDQFLVTRRKATEPAFSGKYATGHPRGTFACVCCGAELFDAKTKFDSGTGWPSFFQPIDPKRVDTAADHEMLAPRVEVLCHDCGAHLGHVFDDGPAPTGLRYCMNSVALKLIPAATPKPAPTHRAAAAGVARKAAATAPPPVVATGPGPARARGSSAAAAIINGTATGPRP